MTTSSRILNDSDCEPVRVAMQVRTGNWLPLSAMLRRNAEKAANDAHWRLRVARDHARRCSAAGVGGDLPELLNKESGLHKRATRRNILNEKRTPARSPSFAEPSAFGVLSSEPKGSMELKFPLLSVPP